MMVDILEPMILQKHSPEEFKVFIFSFTQQTWILEEFRKQNIADTTLINEKLWLLPQDRETQKIAEDAALKSAHILAVVYIRTMKKYNLHADVGQFVLELAIAMEKLEVKHRIFIKHNLY